MPICLGTSTGADGQSGKCFYCDSGDTARCLESKVFGSSALDGGQAEFVRVPFADSTIVKAPGAIPGKALVLMADIFPTGYYGVQSAISLAPSVKLDQATMVIIGCGPVGLCAIVAAAQFKPKRLFAIDSVESRLDQAKKLGAEPLNYQSDAKDVIARIKEETEGRGADFVVEVVGLSPALRTAFDAVRPFGVISSIGVHNAEVGHVPGEIYPPTSPKRAVADCLRFHGLPRKVTRESNQPAALTVS